MKIFGWEIKREEKKLSARERLWELEAFVDELDGNLLDFMDSTDSKFEKQDAAIAEFKKDFGLFIGMADALVKELQGRIAVLEEKAEKRTVSDMTMAENKPKSMDQIMDEWVNGKEA